MEILYFGTAHFAPESSAQFTPESTAHFKPESTAQFDRILQYVNQNFDKVPFYAEIPYIPDTLVLNENYTFHSDFYGNGTYTINKVRDKIHIELSYNYTFGVGSVTFPIENKDGKIKIFLSGDNQYYLKLGK